MVHSALTLHKIGNKTSIIFPENLIKIDWKSFDKMIFEKYKLFMVATFANIV